MSLTDAIGKSESSPYRTNMRAVVELYGAARAERAHTELHDYGLTLQYRMGWLWWLLGFSK